MSKVGEKTIEIPPGTMVEVQNHQVSIKGPQGEMAVNIHGRLEIVVDDKIVTVSRKGNDKGTRSLHGLTRSLIANAIRGVNKHWEKILEVIGTGFKVRLQGESLIFDVGYSHSV